MYVAHKHVRILVLVIRHANHIFYAPSDHVMWPIWFHHIFPHYLIHGRIPGRKCLNIKCRFWVFPKRLSETFLILRRIQRYIINVHRPSRNVPIILIRLNKTWVISIGFRKILKHIISWKSDQCDPSCCIRKYVACERMDGLTEATQLIVGFWNFAKAPNQFWVRRGLQQRIPRIKCDRTESLSRVTSHVRQKTSQSSGQHWPDGYSVHLILLAQCNFKYWKV
jgi:hypothetical protein